MLTIKMRTDPESLRLQLDGHAGAGKWGTDIVCAAASILTYTAAAAAQQLYREGALTQPPHIRLEPGNALVAVENCTAAKKMLEVVLTGFALLAVRYPKYVCLIRKEFVYEEKS